MASRITEDRVIAGTHFQSTQHVLSPGQYRTTYKLNGERISRRLYISHKLAAEQRDRDQRAVHLMGLHNNATCGTAEPVIKSTVEINEVTCPDCLAVHDDFCDHYR